MAEQSIDIERMIMRNNYLLEVSDTSASNGIPNMEREQYQQQIRELIDAVQTLLDANRTMGEKLKTAESVAEQYKAHNEESDRKIAELEAKLDKITGEVKSRRRKMHGKNSEKQSGRQSDDAVKTKDEAESDYIESGSPKSSSADGEETDDTSSAATNPKKDMSNRPVSIQPLFWRYD